MKGKCFPLAELLSSGRSHFITGKPRKTLLVTELPEECDCGASKSRDGGRKEGNGCSNSDADSEGERGKEGRGIMP
jgi:hypothetical protein